MDTNSSKIEIPSLSPDEAISTLLSEHRLDDIKIGSALEAKKYEEWCEKILRHESCLGKELTIEQRRKTWFISEPFASMDVLQWLLEKCKTTEEITRVEYEYDLFHKKDLITMLRLLIYLVDHFRKHKYVWGVGRGSSVASYCLFLIGINKIDPIKYNLDIHEFLK